ncbi:hypothetical protein OROHE_004347 [Orobanche hederae]
MATLYSLRISCLFPAVLTFGLVISSYAKEEKRQVYIVYMGGLPHGEKNSLSSFHEDMIRRVVNNSGFGEVVSIFRSVIDSGVWPESPSFDDKGFGPPPKKWKGVCEGGENFTCNWKLIGARYYGTSNSTRDTYGHGTHTASTAIGRNVKHASFYGLGKGTARGGASSTRIAAYKACDPLCLDADLLAAFDDAIADSVDIISISLGYSEPCDFTSDSIAIGAFHAMRKGILTVHAAGNNGPTLGEITSVVPWLFTIGASSIDRRFTDKVKLGNGQVISGGAIDTVMRGKFLVPLVYGQDVSSKCSELKSQQCAEGCLNASLVKKKIVVCDQLVDSTEAYQAVAAGIIKKNTHLLPPFVVPFPESWLTPSKFVRLLNYINSTKHAGRTPLAYISSTESTRDRHAPMVAHYSARAPNSIIPNILKPDVTAPGTDILAAYPPDAPPSLLVDRRSVNFSIMSGTSMSCPHVTGLAAYVKSFHPNWSPSAIKSAPMTTAGCLKDNNISNAEFAYGAGHVDPVKAVDPGLVYDISTQGYIKHLCDLGCNTSTVRKITGDNTSCPGGSKLKIKHNELNYPTMAAKVHSSKAFKVKFFRTVTNVGSAESRYKAKIVKHSDSRVVVRPRVLKFRALNQRKSFVVTVSGKISHRMIIASIVWFDGRHKVRSPIVVGR